MGGLQKIVSVFFGSFLSRRKTQQNPPKITGQSQFCFCMCVCVFFFMCFSPKSQWKTLCLFLGPIQTLCFCCVNITWNPFPMFRSVCSGPFLTWTFFFVCVCVYFACLCLSSSSLICLLLWLCCWNLLLGVLCLVDMLSLQLCILWWFVLEFIIVVDACSAKSKRGRQEGIWKNTVVNSHRAIRDFSKFMTIHSHWRFMTSYEKKATESPWNVTKCRKMSAIAFSSPSRHPLWAFANSLLVYFKKKVNQPVRQISSPDSLQIFSACSFPSERQPPPKKRAPYNSTRTSNITSWFNQRCRPGGPANHSSCKCEQRKWSRRQIFFNLWPCMPLPSKTNNFSSVTSWPACWQLVIWNWFSL